MATITYTIGTSSRNFSTITLWEADLDNATYYDSSDDAVGECYNDTAFDEFVDIDGGGGLGLLSRTLTVATADRHSGTENSGARFLKTANSTCVDIGIDDTTVEWFEFDGNGVDASVLVDVASDKDSVIVKNCLAHGISESSDSDAQGIGMSNPSSTTEAEAQIVMNNIVYDISLSSSNNNREVIGIVIGTNGNRWVKVLNNTVYGITRTVHATETAHGFAEENGGGIPESTKRVVKNNIAMNVTAVGASSAFDFSFDGSTDIDASNNLSEDDTADDGGGSGNITGATAANQFVSTTSGSEDLHIKSGSDCIDAGTDLATTPTGVNIDINGANRDSGSTVWDIGAHQYGQWFTIGTTARDYSTVTLWEADLDDTTIYGTGSSSTGAMYNDSTFTPSAQEGFSNGDTLPLDSIKLTVPLSERHDGTAGTGVLVQPSSNFTWLSIFDFTVEVLIEWIELDCQGTNQTELAILNPGGGVTATAANCIVHGLDGSGGSDSIAANDIANVMNNIIYDCEVDSASNRTHAGISVNTTTGDAVNVVNNTIHDLRCAGAGSCTLYGIEMDDDDANKVFKNNLVTDMDNLSAGSTEDCFSVSSPSTATADKNASSDATAPGSTNYRSITTANQYVSTTSGSEDLHIKSGSDCIDAGEDLGTTPTGVEIDINGRNRDTEGDTWDIGAHEFGDLVAAIGNAAFQLLMGL